MSHQNLHGQQVRNIRVWNGLQLGTVVIAAGAAVTLDDDSPPAIKFVPSVAHNVLMPATNHLNEGYAFFMVNGAATAIAVTLQTSVGGAITGGALAQGAKAWVINVDGAWVVHLSA